MRCLACGSAISNSQTSCASCHRDTRPSQQALDVCLLALFADACVIYLCDKRGIVLASLAATTFLAVLFALSKRRQSLRQHAGRGPCRRMISSPESANPGMGPARKLKLVDRQNRKQP